MGSFEPMDEKNRQTIDIFHIKTQNLPLTPLELRYLWVSDEVNQDKEISHSSHSHLRSLYCSSLSLLFSLLLRENFLLIAKKIPKKEDETTTNQRETLRKFVENMSFRELDSFIISTGEQDFYLSNFSICRPNKITSTLCSTQLKNRLFPGISPVKVLEFLSWKYSKPDAAGEWGFGEHPYRFLGLDEAGAIASDTFVKEKQHKIHYARALYWNLLQELHYAVTACKLGVAQLSHAGSGRSGKIEVYLQVPTEVEVKDKWYRPLAYQKLSLLPTDELLHDNVASIEALLLKRMQLLIGRGYFFDPAPFLKQYSRIDLPELTAGVTDLQQIGGKQRPEIILGDLLRQIAMTRYPSSFSTMSSLPAAAVAAGTTSSQMMMRNPRSMIQRVWGGGEGGSGLQKKIPSQKKSSQQQQELFLV